MIKLNFDEVFSRGELGLFKVGIDTLKSVTSIMGTEFEFDENTRIGSYVHWDNLRVYFNSDDVSEKAEVFFDKKTNYGKLVISQFDGAFKLKYKLKLEQLLRYLNYNNIPYMISNSTHNWDILNITINNNIELVFRLNFLELDRITFYK